MIKLKSLEGKKVHLSTASGNEYVGVVGDYIWADDNEPSYEEAIILDNPIKNGTESIGYPIQFNQSEIAELEIIEK